MNPFVDLGRRLKSAGLGPSPLDGGLAVGPYWITQNAEYPRRWDVYALSNRSVPLVIGKTYWQLIPWLKERHLNGS